MNMLLNFLRRPAHEAIPLRVVVALHADNVAARRKATEVRLQLAVYAATVPHEQRAMETAAFFTKARAGK